MPELFGIPYLLPAIIVAVLLAALLLVLATSRRRRAAGKAPELRHVEEKAHSDRGMPAEKAGATSGSGAWYPPVGTSDDETYEKADDGVSATMDAAAPDPGRENDVTTVAETFRDLDSAGRGNGDQQSLEKARADEATGRGQTAQSLSDLPFDSDPVAPVLAELLGGWGELSSADTRRLSVFKPERIQAALEAVELPRDPKGDRDTRFRLEQLTEYVSELGRGTALAAAGGAGMLAAESAEGSESTEDEPAGEVVDTDPGDSQGSAAPAAPYSLGANGYPEAEPPALIASETTPSAMPWALESDAPDLGTWGEVAGLQVEEVQQYDKWLLDTPDGAVADPAEDSTHSPDDAPASVTSGNIDGTAAGGAAAGVWGATRDDYHDPLDDTLEVVPRSTPLLGGIVKTADDLLALPPDSRMEMVAFLQPTELAAILKRTDDPELKRAIIDTLENVSTPASLDVLRECLTDDDPEIQMYALRAADRVLGSK